jgi:hypothetical protein
MYSYPHGDAKLNRWVEGLKDYRSGKVHNSWLQNGHYILKYDYNVDAQSW